MAQNNLSERHRRIWQAVLRDAAGPLAAYFTPSNYALTNVSLKPVEFNSSELFLREIRDRLDLGRTHALVKILPDLLTAATSEYRHRVTYSLGNIRGKIHMPRFIAARARGDRRGLPVLRAERQLSTPENLLVSEVLRLSFIVTKKWLSTPAAEAIEAVRMRDNLRFAESTFPWSELRTRPRPLLREIVTIVLGRIKMGVVPTSSAIHRLALLFSDDFVGSTGFERELGAPLQMLITEQPEFEDKMFELLCVSWLIRAISTSADLAEVSSSELKGSNKRPLLKATHHDTAIELYFQTRANILPEGRWIDRRTHKKLSGIPDIVLNITRNGETRVILLDAKNRSGSDASEVAYKLLGYKENLDLAPFYAIGIYPSLGTRFHVRRLLQGQHTLNLARMPLLKAQRIVSSVVRQMILRS